MAGSTLKFAPVTVAVSVVGLMAVVPIGSASAAVDHVRHAHRHRHASSDRPAPQPEAPVEQVPQQQGVAGYFGPGPYYAPAPLGYGLAPPRGDLGFALLGALNGGGFRGFVECGNYYARYPGACGF